LTKYYETNQLHCLGKLNGDLQKELLENLITYTNPMSFTEILKVNVLVAENMEVKLADFGLAKIKKSAEGKTTAFSTNLKAEGTVPWMAPELFHREPIFSRKSDIYAYGMILWGIASRKIPYEDFLSGAVGALVLVRILCEIIPTNTPKYFAELISKCWHEITAE
jgi:serine/threonine protein kinase